jgi:hypothetical protein
MRYIAHVTLAFAVDNTHPKTFDIWEHVIVFQSRGSRDALKSALANSKAILDQSDNYQALGYLSKPSLYAVRSLHTDVDLPRTSAKRDDNCWMLSRLGTFSEEEMERIRSFNEVSVPYRVIHID